MEIDYRKVYRVILNNLPWCYRPTGKTIRSLTRYLPDAVVLGYGYYDYYKLWYLIVYSPTFPENPFATASNLTWSQATGARSLTTNKGWEPDKIS